MADSNIQSKRDEISSLDRKGFVGFRFLHRQPVLASIGVLLLGLSLTFILAKREFDHAWQEDEFRFEQLSDSVIDEVRRRVLVYRYGLMGTRSVFAASEHVDRDEFVSLVESRELASEFPGALGIGYIHRVENSEAGVEGLIEEAVNDGLPKFKVTVPPGAAPLPGSVTDDRFIIKYIEPMERNFAAVGLDIGSHPVRREAAERTMLTGDACLTGTIQLVQDDQEVAGFLYLLPYFKPHMPIDTHEQRIEALLGWCYMPLLGPEVFRDLPAVAGNELDIHVFDGDTLRTNTLIYDTDGHVAELEASVYRDQSTEERVFNARREIEIGGRVWTVAISSTPAFVMAPRHTAWLVVVGGSLLSALLGALAYTLGSTTRRACALAEGMTTELRSYADAAQQATEAKSAFLANMSHEIRTPMTAILGFAELLETQIDRNDREILGYTETIRRNGKHLIAIINDVLDLSKIEAGRMDIERLEVDPNSIIADVLSLMQVKAGTGGLKLSAELKTPVPRKIETDPIRMRQILVNLVGNAIKFTQAGEVRVEVSYEPQLNQLHMAVIDTGCGMTPMQAEKLFGAFQQADESTTREYGGTGLGLHISQRLAKMLGGEITCASVKDQGSTFLVTLDCGEVLDEQMHAAGPVAVVDGESAGESGVAPELPSAASKSAVDQPLAGMKILLVEDGPDNQRLIKHHLTKAGAEVTIAENGKLGVEQLTVQGSIEGPLKTTPPFDVMLCDMQMPVMDGYTAVGLLRKLGSMLPIIALTANAMSSDEQKCLDAGCDAYATKPINREVLIRLCREVTHQSVAA